MSTLRAHVIARLITLCCLLGMPCILRAHPMTQSQLLLDVHAEHLSLSLQIPLPALEQAIGHAMGQDALTLDGELASYLLTHLILTDAQARPWEKRLQSLDIALAHTDADSNDQELRAVLHLKPPGSVLRAFDLHYDAVLHRVPSHEAYVLLRHDWAAGRLGDTPELLNVIHLDRQGNAPVLHLTLSEGSRWTGFAAVLLLGMHHIAEGSDHVLFLLLLLLPAPLLARDGRWREALKPLHSIGRILRISLAFTLGHSVTLLVGSLSLLNLPTQAIEVLIGISILISALHAWRPVFARREAWIAGGFGLLHGLAFSFTITELGLDTGQLALSILGFNIGIELMQLLIVVLVLPWLLLMASSPAYGWLRPIWAGLGAVAACGWIWERIADTGNVITAASEAVWGSAPWLLAGLALLGIGAALHTRWRMNSPSKTPD
jgi:hypothetical protein